MKTQHNRAENKTSPQSSSVNQSKHFLPASTEWPTVWVIVAHWLSFTLLTYCYQQLPLWLIITLAAYTLALFSSLQHEVLHGHPTRWEWLNQALVFPAITLWIPFSLYKETHLIHHNNDDLTDPKRDPESYYVSPERWKNFPYWVKQYFRFYNTLSGRFFWGPVHIAVVLFYSELRLIISGNLIALKRWLVHGTACLMALYWVMVICDIPFWDYLLFFVYPGLALSLVRSFLEHRIAHDPKHRTVIVEACPILSLAFLNNNLHAVHHDHPGLAWYKLPKVWKAERMQILEANDQYYFSGYLEVIRRYWGRPKEEPVYSSTGRL
ncbi:fatty acid desaturase [Leucothrix pacifica]|uniref:fatty acid desaturase n=1 Tax=Leucothrix pacifica TaxID=1247513 RepID=UPI0015E8457D|nr:fatty acid desaturase [Leucothrix pacifica]